ncbi:retroviral-like aspartic protease family protein [uncultured Sphingomonas sp.]|uniref:retroviral-like aspartic protease family protein n=1 Tax=uncultured Sphingomonas sp. TaxID=158754 RepID=UPI0025F2ACA6|nr:retroviral-like aspartic protease family protein [uncultured Sphingomonas sp.]
MLHLCASLALLLAAGQPAAPRDPQVVVPPLPPPPAAEAVTPVDSAELLAFAEYEQRMRVPVRVNGAGPFQFVIDTGAERTVISRQVATALRLATGPRVNVAAMTGVVPVPTAHIPSLEIDAVPRGIAIDAPQLEGPHLGADGLVGLDSLANNALLIDFDDRVMHVQKSRRRQRAAAPDEIVVVAKSVMGRLIVTDARFAGKRISVVLDTGTAVSVGNTALLKLVENRVKTGTPIRIMSVTGAMLTADYRIVPRVSVGGIEVNTLPVAFADVPPFKRLNLDEKPALFLGMDAMKLFRQVRIDFPNREVRFMLPRDVVRPGMTARVVR